MNKIIEWFTKKNVLVSSIVFLFLYIVSYYNKILMLPNFYRDFCCIDDRKLNLFFIFLPIFIFTIIFINLNKRTFSSWKKFTLIYLVFYIIIYFLVPTQANGYLWFQRETISFVGSIIYSLISLILIIFKSLKK